MSKIREVKPGSRFVRLPQQFNHALGLYGRLSAAEHVALSVVTHHLWGFGGMRGRDAVAIGRREFQARAPQSTRETVRRAVACLMTPAGQVYQWGRGKGQRKQGHGILLVVKQETSTTERVYAIQEDWRRWGWPEGVDLDPYEAILAQYEVATVQAWGDDAVAVAQLLRDSVLDRVGEQADVPPAQSTSRTWARWCTNMQNLIDRGYAVNDVLHVVRHIHSDDYFAKKVVGQHADKVFHTNFEELLIGARRAHRRRNPW